MGTHIFRFTVTFKILTEMKNCDTIGGQENRIKNAGLNHASDL